MKNKLIISLMLCMVLISLVGASQDSLGTYKQGETITLLQICGTCTYNNITSIVYPNSTHQVIDSAMTKRGAEYTYTLTDTTQLGPYSVNGFGDLDGTAAAWAYDFDVTISGLNAESILDNAILILLFTLSIIFFLIALNKGNHILGFLSGISFSLTGMYAMIYGFAGVTNLYTQGASIIILGWGIIVLLSSALEGLEDSR